MKGRRHTTFVGHFALSLMLVVASAVPAIGQQYITDDAAITEYRACQIQMWHGERSSWMLPVCTPLPGVELSLGFIAVWEDDADGHFEYTAQAKTVMRPLAMNSWGVGFVLGTGRDPAFSSTTSQSYSLYAYLPFSLSLANDRVVLHQNTGWFHGRREGSGHNAVTWPARADIGVRKNLFAVAEVLGAEGIGPEGGAGSPAEYQAGLRTWLRPETVQLDVRFGALLRNPGIRAAGWTVGLALIAPPFL